MNMIEQESLELVGPHRYWMWATCVTMFVAGFVSILLVMVIGYFTVDGVVASVVSQGWTA